MGKHSACQTERNSTGAVFVCNKLTNSLPWDWTGYASLDAMVLYDPEWDKINPHQSAAICQWVETGASC